MTRRGERGVVREVQGPRRRRSRQVRGGTAPGTEVMRASKSAVTTRGILEGMSAVHRWLPIHPIGVASAFGVSRLRPESAIGDRTSLSAQ